jgi:hypothetical protein
LADGLDLGDSRAVVNLQYPEPTVLSTPARGRSAHTPINHFVFAFCLTLPLSRQENSAS